MKWSKLKKSLEERLADELRGKLSYHLTTYANSTGYNGRAWLAYNGEEIANFSNQESWNRHQSYSNILTKRHFLQHDEMKDEERTPDKLVEKGEFSKDDFGYTAFEFLNTSIEEALTSENPIMRALSAVDKRVGKRRLKKIAESEKHPLIQKLIELRQNEHRKTA